MKSTIAIPTNWEAQPIVINHEEQWWEIMQNKNEFSFISPIASNKFNSFLTEEEYLNVVNLKVGAKSVTLKKVKLVKCKLKNDGLHVTMEWWDD